MVAEGRQGEVAGAAVVERERDLQQRSSMFSDVKRESTDMQAVWLRLAMIRKFGES